VAVAGRPNVGKSTLVNALCGRQVAIVSDKPQTTRRRIRGVVHGSGYQLVLADLPGFQRPRDPLTERMQRTVDDSLEDVEAVVLVLDGSDRIGAGDRFVAERVFALGVPVVIALNKVDRMKPAEIAAQIDVSSKLGDFEALHPVSALTGDGLGPLLEDLVEGVTDSFEQTLHALADVASVSTLKALCLSSPSDPPAHLLRVQVGGLARHCNLFHGHR